MMPNARSVNQGKNDASPCSGVVIGSGAQQPGQAATVIEDLLSELQHREAAQAGAQQECDQLRIGKRCRPSCEQLLARPCIRRNILQHHGLSRAS